MEIPRAFIQHPVHAKVSVTILSYTIQIISIHHVDIDCSKNFLLSLDNVDFALSVYFIDANVTGFLVENNINKPIYISRNFCLGQIQELKYPNIE